MSRRQASHQQGPRGSLTGFPRTTLKAQSGWYRCHLAAFGPWFFASHPSGEVGGGRWDLPEPLGTCYVAESPLAALKEVAGPDLLEVGFLTRPWLEGRSVSELRLGSDVAAANLRSPRVSEFGASAELMGALAYAVTQEWARGWKAAGFGGVVYGMRFAANLRGLGIFGPAGAGNGEVVSTSSSLDVASAGPGLRVVDLPSSRSMNVVEPPS